MSTPKIILLSSVLLFAGIGITAVVKKRGRTPVSTTVVAKEAPVKNAPAAPKAVAAAPPRSLAVTSAPLIVNATGAPVSREPASPLAPSATNPLDAKDDFPMIDRVHQLFTKGSTKLPIVETITYESSVPWLKGRPAWLADYAAHYTTSRHFIARSLNGRPDYSMQTVSSGCRFNVFRRDKHIQFWLLVDLSRCKMGFYYVDLDTSERILLKTYHVGVGSLAESRPSGTLTPLGRYSIGNKIAVYSPGKKGLFQGKEVEMMRVFGTRWLPFDEEIEGCTLPAKGYGIQGAPWVEDARSHELVENRDCVGKYGSDGCIRLSVEDMEELFSIVITKPTFVEIVKDFRQARLPGVEVAAPRR